MEQAIEKLTSDQLEELREAFQTFDIDRSGSIDAKELGYVFRSLGINATKKEVYAMLRRVDVDDSGTISFGEFVTLMTQQLNKEPSKRD